MTTYILLDAKASEENIINTILHLSSRHDSFRTGFRMIDGRPIQFIKERVDFSLNKEDISQLDDNTKQLKIVELADRVSNEIINIENPPLIRFLYLKWDDGHSYLLINMHHIISDGFSLKLLGQEFNKIYNSLKETKKAPIDKLRVQYKDYAIWHNKFTGGGLQQKSRNYWLKKIGNKIHPVDLPFDYLAGKQSKKGASLKFALGNKLRKELYNYILDNNISLFTVMFSAYLVLLHKISNQKDIVCSVINAGRYHSSLQNIIGFFVNPLIFRMDIDLNLSFDSFNKTVNDEILEMFENQAYPLEFVFEELKTKYPDISIAYNMLNLSDNINRHIDENQNIEYFDNNIDAKYDLEVYVTEMENNILVVFAYKKELFKKETIEYIGSEYIKILEYFIENSNSSYEDYQLKTKKIAF